MVARARRARKDEPLATLDTRDRRKENMQERVRGSRQDIARIELAANRREAENDAAGGRARVLLQISYLEFLPDLAREPPLTLTLSPEGRGDCFTPVLKRSARGARHPVPSPRVSRGEG